MHPTFYVNVLLVEFIGSSIYFLIQHTRNACLLCGTDGAGGTEEEQENPGRR